MNWGNRLLIVFLLFGTLICTLVFRSIRANIDLVSKDYYKEELAYQQVIDSRDNTATLSSPVKISRQEDGVLVTLPPEVRDRAVTGTIWFYCPSNADKDKKFPLQADHAGNQLIPSALLGSGHYILKISWEQEGIRYFQEDRLIIP